MIPNLVDLNVMELDIKKYVFRNNTFYFNMFIGVLLMIVCISFFFTIRRKNNNPAVLLEQLNDILEKAEYYSSGLSINELDTTAVQNRSSLKTVEEFPNIYEHSIYL
jgi:hypothetical protein